MYRQVGASRAGYKQQLGIPIIIIVGCDINMNTVLGAAVE